jgi:hypothetical protein
VIEGESITGSVEVAAVGVSVSAVDVAVLVASSVLLPPIGVAGGELRSFFARALRRKEGASSSPDERLFRWSASASQSAGIVRI